MNHDLINPHSNLILDTIIISILPIGKPRPRELQK